MTPGKRGRPPSLLTAAQRFEKALLAGLSPSGKKRYEKLSPKDKLKFFMQMGCNRGELTQANIEIARLEVEKARLVLTQAEHELARLEAGGIGLTVMNEFNSTAMAFILLSAIAEKYPDKVWPLPELQRVLKENYVTMDSRQLSKAAKRFSITISSRGHPKKRENKG